MARGIQNREQLNQILKLEKDIYIKNGWGMGKFMRFLMGDVTISLYRYVRLLREAEYHRNQHGRYHRLLYIYYSRRKNKLGKKLGLEIWDNVFEEGLTIYHAGNIVVNGLAHVGKNCKLHGSNCIGNNGKTSPAPIIGNNVRLGVGAKVIGGVHIADYVTIAASAVVIRSCDIEGATLAGVPARVVKVTPPSSYHNE